MAANFLMRDLGVYIANADLLREAARVRVQIIAMRSPSVPFRVQLQASRLDGFALAAGRADIEETPSWQRVTGLAARLVHLDARFVSWLGRDLADAMNGANARKALVHDLDGRPRLHRLMQLVIEIWVNALFSLRRKGVVRILAGER